MRLKGLLNPLVRPFTSATIALLLLIAPVATSQTHDITLSGRMAESARPWLGEPERQSLAELRPLKVGAVFPDYPPPCPSCIPTATKASLRII